MTFTLAVRVATPADIGAVDALLAASYPKLLKADYPPSVMVLAVPLLARANPRLVASGHYFVVSGPDAAVIGAGGCTPGRGGWGHIRHLATHPRHVRRGVGRRLMARLFEHARSLGLRRIACEATRTAVPFYAAMGFEALGPIEVELRPGIVFPAVAMRRDL